MKVAVLMSSYNGQTFLKEQIESILAQDVEAELDLWVRDDGSWDDTTSILQEYMGQGKLRWYAGENVGPAKSFLELLQNVGGYDYYAFADQDDVWHTDKIRKGLCHLQNIDGPALYFANAKLVDAQLKSLGRNVYRSIPCVDFYSVTCGAGILGCTVIFNQELAGLIQSKPMPEKLRMHDYYLGVVCTLHDGRIVYDHQVCIDYRQHGNNVVGSSWRKIDAIKNRLRQITTKREHTIDELAEFICNHYTEVPDMAKWYWLRAVADYRKSMFAAAKLAFDKKVSFSSRNKSITMRLAILMRNR